MIRAALAALVLLVSFAAPAAAQSCGSFPYTLTNGTTADASQVMANFEHVRSCANSNQVVPSLLRGWLAGLTLRNSVSNPTTVIDVTAGVANSSDATTLMSLPSFSKDVSAAWAVGSGNGCLAAGSSMQATTWYHLYVIARTDTGVVDLLCSTAASSPNLPANYNKSRRIGSYRVSGTLQVVPFIQRGDTFLWMYPHPSVSLSNPGTAALLRTLLVPSSLPVRAITTTSIAIGTTGTTLYVSTPDLPDATPGTTNRTFVQDQVNNSQGNGQVVVWTDSSSQVRMRFSASDSNVSALVTTLGWDDPRGRND